MVTVTITVHFSISTIMYINKTVYVLRQSLSGVVRQQSGSGTEMTIDFKLCNPELDNDCVSAHEFYS